MDGIALVVRQPELLGPLALEMLVKGPDRASKQVNFIELPAVPMERNQALDFELHKGMTPSPLNIYTGCDVDDNLHLRVLLRSKGGTQSVCINAAEEIFRVPAGADSVSKLGEDGREDTHDFLPPVVV